MALQLKSSFNKKAVVLNYFTSINIWHKTYIHIKYSRPNIYLYYIILTVNNLHFYSTKLNLRFNVYYAAAKSHCSKFNGIFELFVTQPEWAVDNTIQKTYFKVFAVP